MGRRRQTYDAASAWIYGGNSGADEEDKDKSKHVLRCMSLLCCLAILAALLAFGPPAFFMGEETFRVAVLAAAEGDDGAEALAVASAAADVAVAIKKLPDMTLKPPNFQIQEKRSVAFLTVL